MKSWRSTISRLAIFVAITFWCALPALAEEAANQDPVESPTGQIFKWLNFLLVFGGIGFLIAKNGGAFFRGNAKEISASIIEAQAVKAEAVRELQSTEQKIARLDQEVSEMRELARSESDVEAQRLRASGEAEIEKIKTAARVEMRAAERAAQQELRGVASTMAVDRAAAIVKSRMNTQVRSKILQYFLDELGRSTN
jgi:F0F1-type ATP synthase membrane subunit b/b'